MRRTPRSSPRPRGPRAGAAARRPRGRLARPPPRRARARRQHARRLRARPRGTRRVRREAPACRSSSSATSSSPTSWARCASADCRLRSQARHVFSIRGFYAFALREGLAAADPTENVRPPRAFRGLPRYLTPPQVDALLAAPGRGDRRRAARPRHPGGALRDRPARLGAHLADARRPRPRAGRRARAGEGEQGAPGAARPRGAALDPALPRRDAAGCSPGTPRRPWCS